MPTHTSHFNVRAQIIIGALFGDEGKGLTTNYLCSQRPDLSKIVVRFSGGQQAGHTVIKDGIKHIHSNYACGVLDGLESYYTEHCTLYPNYIAKEKDKLEDKGIYNPKLIVHPFSMLTTPSDVAYNRIREKRVKHGSCGMGIGATMTRNNTTGYKLYAIDIVNHDLFMAKLSKISQYYQSIIQKEDLKEFLDIEKREMELYAKVYNQCFQISDYNYLRSFDLIIFEGSQGILLDMDHGIFPNVTYANTTSKNAISVCKKLGIVNIEMFYITRCYQTRHGEGWMSNNKPVLLINTEEEINKQNIWQGDFRTVEMDYNLLNYAIAIDSQYCSDLPTRRSLVITCMDQRPDFTFDYSKVNDIFDDVYTSSSPESVNLKENYELKPLYI